MSAGIRCTAIISTCALRRTALYAAENGFNLAGTATRLGHLSLENMAIAGCESAAAPPLSGASLLGLSLAETGRSSLYD